MEEKLIVDTNMYGHLAGEGVWCFPEDLISESLKMVLSPSVLNCIKYSQESLNIHANFEV